jgi:hypothetical protein
MTNFVMLNDEYCLAAMYCFQMEMGRRERGDAVLFFVLNTALQQYVPSEEP